METKAKNILTKIANIFAIIIGAFVLFVAVIAIISASTKENYINLFGYTAYAVETDSMKGSKPDSFNEKALIFVRLLGEDEKGDLEEGQVITFWDYIGGKEVLNTHRIIEIDSNGNYVTQGDKAAVQNPDATETISPEDVVGAFSSKIEGLGGVVLFIQSSTGFLVTVVIPSALVVLYCGFLLVRNILSYSKVKREDDIQKIKEELKKEMENGKDE